MRILDREALDAEALAVDAHVAQTQHIDLFCSSTLWALPADAALMPRREPWLRATPEGYIALTLGEHPHGWRYLQPLEGMWGLANPFLGADAQALVEAFYQDAMARRAQWDVLLLSGISQASEQYRAVLRAFTGKFRVQVGYPRQRFAASLEGGVEGFLGRRQRKHRANLRRVERKANEAGLCCEAMPHGGVPAGPLYQRILRIESQSWKGKEGVGINQGDMRRFYELMLPRLLDRGALRGLFLKDAQGQDIAYMLGGVFAGTFRGLQFSHLEPWAPYSPGNLSQLRMVELLSQEGDIHLYDLGSEMDYKKRWGEDVQETVMIVVMR